MQLELILTVFLLNILCSGLFILEILHQVFMWGLYEMIFLRRFVFVGLPGRVVTSVGLDEEVDWCLYPLSFRAF